MGNDIIRIDGKEYVVVDRNGDGIPETLEEVGGGLFGRLRQAATTPPAMSGPTHSTPPPSQADSRNWSVETPWEAQDHAAAEETAEEDVPAQPAPATRGCMSVVSVLVTVAAFILFVIGKGGFTSDDIKKAIEEFAGQFTEAPPPESDKPVPPAREEPSASPTPPTPITLATPGSAAPARTGKKPALHLAFEDALASTGARAWLINTDKGDARFAPGMHGQALKLDDGRALWLRETAPKSLARGYTIEFWFKPATSLKMVRGATQTVMLSEAAILQLRGSGKADMLVMFDDGGYVAQHTHEYGVRFAPGQWHHIALVAAPQAATVTLYVNGVEVFTQPNRIGQRPVALSQHLGDVWLGNSSRGDEGFDGLIDEFHIYDAARTPAQVRAAAQGK